MPLINDGSARPSVVDETSAPRPPGCRRDRQAQRCATYAARRLPVGHSGDARDLDAGPAQQHGQGAGVVGVATQVCVEVNPHPARMPAGGVTGRRAAAPTEEDVSYLLQQAYLTKKPLLERN